jgi:hypothetical protein
MDQSTIEEEERGAPEEENIRIFCCSLFVFSRDKHLYFNYQSVNQ